MDYVRIYDRLIARARDRVIDGYTEKHHVVPKCIDKSSKDIVRLTPEEHYLAHQLLVKMYPGHRGLVVAALRMTGAPHPILKRSNKLYGWLRRRLSDSLRGKPRSEECKVKMAAARIGRKLSETHKANIAVAGRGRKMSPEAIAKTAAANRGRVVSVETRERLRVSHRGMTGRKHSVETKIKMRVAALGKLKSPEHCQHLSEAKKGSIAWNKGVPMREDVRNRMIAATERPIEEIASLSLARLSRRERVRVKEYRKHHAVSVMN